MASFNNGVRKEVCTEVDFSGIEFDIDDIELDSSDFEELIGSGNFDGEIEEYAEANGLLKVNRDDALNWLKEETGCSFNTLTNMIAMLKAIQEDRMVGVIHLDEV